MKKFLFIILSLLPAAIVLALVGFLAVDLAKINKLSFNYAFLNYYNTPWQESIEVKNGKVSFNNLYNAGFEAPGKKEFTYGPEDDLVYVFGESSVVVPSYQETFPFFLEKRLKENNQKVSVINFGLDA